MMVKIYTHFADTIKGKNPKISNILKLHQGEVNADD